MTRRELTATVARHIGLHSFCERSRLDFPLMLSALAQRICALHGGTEPGTRLAPPGFASIRRQPARARVSARADASLTGLAEARARCLLRRVLDTNQRRQYEAYGCFAVQVADRSTFGILPRPFFNVMELRTGVLYCCVMEGKVPLADLMLAQKLLLECDPDLFFSTANATGKGCTQDDRLRCLLAAWEAGRGGCNRDIA